MDGRENDFSGGTISRPLRVLAAQIALALIATAGLVLVQRDPLFIRYFVVGACSTALYLGFLSPHIAFFALGFVLPVMPFFRSWALTACAAALLIGLSRQRPHLPSTRTATLSALGLIAFPIFASSLYTLYVDLDPLLYETLAADGLLVRYLTAVQPAGYRALLISISFLTALQAAAAVFGADDASEQRFKEGLAAGISCSLIVLLCQLAALHPAFDLNRGPFFIHAGQYAAAFSDPNAFGVFAAIASPLLLSQRGRLSRVAGAALGICALWSGSRTYLLGLVIWGAVSLIKLVLRTSGRTRQRFVICGCALVLSAFLLTIPALNDRLQNIAPPTVNRALKTINVQSVHEMLYSRALYLKLALKVWKDAPVTGVGQSRFYFLQESAAKELKLELSGWRDNANNFYLQTLAESGVLGLLLTILGIAAVLYLAKTSGAYLSVLSMFSVLLITGPHTNFEEVCFLWFILCALASRSAPCSASCASRLKLAATLGAILLVAANGIKALEAPDSVRGIYPAEATPEGPVAWTGLDTEIPPCNKPRRLLLRATNPDISLKPVVVRLDGAEDVQISINDSAWREVLIQPTAASTALRVSRTWSPLKLGLGADPRSLGVMVRLESLSCGDYE